MAVGRWGIPEDLCVESGIFVYRMGESCVWQARDLREFWKFPNSLPASVA